MNKKINFKNRIANYKKLKNYQNTETSNRKKEIIKKIGFCILLFILVIIGIEIQSYAATPKLVSKMEDAFRDIASWIIKLSTPAAAVAVGTGIFMKKFSFGDEERIRMGKKVIRTSLFSYAFILAIDLILAAIKSFI